MDYFMAYFLGLGTAMAVLWGLWKWVVPAVLKAFWAAIHRVI